MINVACSWSGGKDCSYALLQAKLMGYNPQLLLNMIDEDLKTSRSHGLPVSILEKQAEAMNMKLLSVPTSREKYEENFIRALKVLKNEYSINTVVFGDIDLVAHRDWIERVCQIAGINTLFPLWNINREKLAFEIVNSGIESVIVSCNQQMGKDFLGKIYSQSMINEFKVMGIDTCGEDGEFHSFVINGPHFKKTINLPQFKNKFHDNFHFIDWDNAIINS